MVRVGVIFELRRAKTVPGESIFVCGDLPQLGAWDPYDEAAAHHVELRTGPRMYPRWSMPRPVWLDVPSRQQSGTERFTVEYKYVRDRRELSGFDGPTVQWEDYANRALSLPREDGSIWIVSDAVWNSETGPARVSRTHGPEVISRWSSLDAEWAALQSPSRRAQVEIFHLTPRAGLAEPDAQLQSSGDCAEQDRQAPDCRPSAYPIEDEFKALAPKDAQPGGRRKVPALPTLPTLGFLPKAEDNGTPRSAELVEAKAKVDQLSQENAELRKKLQLLATPRTAPEAIEEGKLWPPSTRSLQEPDVEPQLVEEEEEDSDEELIPEVF